MLVNFAGSVSGGIAANAEVARTGQADNKSVLQSIQYYHVSISSVNYYMIYNY
jgi:hypothetical protein